MNGACFHGICSRLWILGICSSVLLFVWKLQYPFFSSALLSTPWSKDIFCAASVETDLHEKSWSVTIDSVLLNRVDFLDPLFASCLLRSPANLMKELLAALEALISTLEKEKKSYGNFLFIHRVMKYLLVSLIWYAGIWCIVLLCFFWYFKYISWLTWK